MDKNIVNNHHDEAKEYSKKFERLRPNLPSNLDDLISLSPSENNLYNNKCISCFLKTKWFLFSFVVILCIIYTTYFVFFCDIEGFTNTGYIVNSDVCKIPDISPYNYNTMQFFFKKEYRQCSNKLPWTTLEFNEKIQMYTLKLLSKNIKCTYQSIDRNLNASEPDSSNIMGPIIDLTESITTIPSTIHSIFVKCSSNRGGELYKNVHAMMPKTREIRDRLNYWKQRDTKQPISVLLMGIDSISRLHLIRAMPKTLDYLRKNQWLELSGYNKVVDDNTFPNIMAILTGYRRESYEKDCDPEKRGGIERCPFIWDLYRNNGYVTAYAEDVTVHHTFNLGRKGFIKQPVDYYLRPLMKVAESQLNSNKMCVGFKNAVDYVFDYAIELGTRYKNDAYFGLFWTSSFSHDNLSQSSSMDLKILNYLKKMQMKEILSHSIIIFFSDHGMRFGPSRKYYSGHLEERLPFMFIWLPPWIKSLYPEFVNALQINNNRLTCPYDIHMTLKHIMELNERTSEQPKAKDCPNCQTVLQPVPYNRSCEDIAIDDHWCTCIPFEETFTDIPLLKRIAQYSIDYMNNYTRSFKDKKNRRLCYELDFYKIFKAYKSIGIKLNVYRIVFYAQQGFLEFESTVQHLVNNDTFKKVGMISRINSYSRSAKCVPPFEYTLNLYCDCRYTN